MKTILKQTLMILLATGLVTQTTPAKADIWATRLIGIGVVAALWKIEGMLHQKFINMQQSTKIAATVRALYTKEIHMVADATENGTLIDTARFVKMQDYDKIATLFYGLPLCFKSGSPIGVWELSTNMAKIHELYLTQLERNLSKKERRLLAKKVEECDKIIATFTKSKFNLATFQTVANDMLIAPAVAQASPKIEVPEVPGKQMIPGITIAVEDDTYKIRIVGLVTPKNDENKRTYVCGTDTTLTLIKTYNGLEVKALSPKAQTTFELTGILITDVTDSQQDGVTTITLKFERK